MKCSICNGNLSAPVGGLFALPSVTSDCRPWTAGRSVQICDGCGVMKRCVHPLAEAEFSKVYEGYKASPEPDGRTKRILEFVKDKIQEPKSVLDFGCGGGWRMHMLQFQYPDAKVFGYEPTEHGKKRPDGKFDLITLFHVLEHVEDVYEVLAYIKSVLTENGHVLIQVPYMIMGPFDLVVADHVWHFNKASLYELLQKNGFVVSYKGNDIIKKELTLLAHVGDPKFSDIKELLFREQMQMQEVPKNKIAIDWLLSYKSFLDKIDEPVAVYGTGPAAAWAGAVLKENVQCYLDDDEARRQWRFNGKDVYPPVTSQYPIVAPFPDYQLAEIKKKKLRWFQ